LGEELAPVLFRQDVKSSTDFFFSNDLFGSFSTKTVQLLSKVELLVERWFNVISTQVWLRFGYDF
jgi:hypothetical protein